MKLSDLRKEAISGIEPDRKWEKRPILMKRGFLPNSPEFHLASMRVNCECGACIGIKLGFTICPVCGRDLNRLVNKRTIHDLGSFAEICLDVSKKTSHTIRLLSKSILETNNFHKAITNASLGLPVHWNSRCKHPYPVFDPTDARIADLQRHKNTYANVFEEEKILSPLILPDDNKGLK